MEVKKVGRSEWDIEGRMVKKTMIDRPSSKMIAAEDGNMRQSKVIHEIC